LSHLATGRIARAQNQHPFLHARPLSGFGNQWRVRLQAAQTESITFLARRWPSPAELPADSRTAPGSAAAVRLRSANKGAHEFASDLRRDGLHVDALTREEGPCIF